MDRVVVIGISGSGKSSLARELAALVGAPHVELDALFWAAEWQPVPRAEFRQRAEAAVAGDRWVVDGNYSIVRDVVWPRAQTVIWLNLPFATVLWRVLVRTLRRVSRGTVLWNDNRESLRRSFFSRESILVWVLSAYHRRRREFTAIRASGAFPHLHWIEFRRPADVREFLHGSGRRAELMHKGMPCIPSKPSSG